MVYKFKCSECKSNDVELVRIKFSNGIWHVKARCNGCGRARYVNRNKFYSEDLPVAMSRKAMKADKYSSDDGFELL